jgi:medium-chain acyl-[acyl-carrier-protein] hydrolase
MDGKQLLWKQPFEVYTWQADQQRKARISTLFNYMQEAASRHATHLGVGQEQLASQGRYWLLSRVKMIWDYLPLAGARIQLHTWPKGQARLFSVRDFRFFEEGGKAFGRATTAWLLMDSREGKLLRLDHLHPDFPLFPDSALEELPSRIKSTGKESFLYTREARYTDIDFIGHVNNARYIEWIWDGLSQEHIRRLSNGGQFQMEYLSECLPGEKVLLVAHQEDEESLPSVISGRPEGDGRELFRAKLV